MDTVPTLCRGCMTGGHDPSERKKLGDNHYYHPRSKHTALTDLQPSDSDTKNK